ncbi:unnamed protein product [Callosobruchus maculatus]|uniref:Methyltransferase domain-containing protein n=1 Tax=Callosobruchus maculatus TaxID=64391 RepID=A0A653DF69_CALMS|nr:unnamed protein product [Callosobruchus maculatus]
MSLPATYVSSIDYISDCLGFLKSYQWLYNYYNTHVLVHNVFENFPLDWIDYFKAITNEELNLFPLNQLKKECPKTLQDLMEKIASLKPNIEVENIECVAEPICNYGGLSQKKYHEIINLAAAINQICRQYKLDFVLDVGSGLGYLSHLLNSRYNYKVLGIECKSEFVKLAYANQEKHHPNCHNLVKFEEHFISSESADILTELYITHFSSIGPSIGCLAGLHACADLSITILELFSKLDFMKCLIIMPCCYHRIELENESETRECFKNFPSSEKFKNIYKTYEADTYLRRPFLRLACQQTHYSFVNMSEAEHEDHAFKFLCRAILQEVAEIGKIYYCYCSRS